MKELKEKYKNKLWIDLKTNREKYEFLISGRAKETGIIAPVIIREITKAYSILVKSEVLGKG